MAAAPSKPRDAASQALPARIRDSLVVPTDTVPQSVDSQSSGSEGFTGFPPDPNPIINRPPHSVIESTGCKEVVNEFRHQHRIDPTAYQHKTSSSEHSKESRCSLIELSPAYGVRKYLSVHSDAFPFGPIG